MTLSGHSFEYAVQRVGAENQGLPCPASVLLLTLSIALLKRGSHGMRGL